MALFGNVTRFSEQDSPALREFFVDELKDVLWAEHHILDALPKMIKATTSSKLKKAFEDHLTQTRTHVSRLEEAFSKIGEDAKPKKCEAMAGIVKEGEGIIEETEDGSMTRDCGLIIAAQKVEHYEIATYGSLRTLARKLGYDEVAEILQTTLDEEGEADHLLTAIAEGYVNEKAAAEE